MEALRFELREKPARLTQPLPKCLGSLHARLPSLPLFHPPIYLFPEWRLRRAVEDGGGGLASPFPSPRPSVVSSASAHSHTQAAAEASDIAPGAAKGIFSSDVNVFYFGMLNFNKG